MNIRRLPLAAIACGLAIAAAGCGTAKPTGPQRPADPGYGHALTSPSQNSDLDVTTQRFCSPDTATVTLVATAMYGGSGTPSVTEELGVPCSDYRSVGGKLPADPGFGQPLTSPLENNNLDVTTQRFCNPDTRTVALVSTAMYGNSGTPAVNIEAGVSCATFEHGAPGLLRDPGYGRALLSSTGNDSPDVYTQRFCGADTRQVTLVSTPKYGKSGTPAVTMVPKHCPALG